jgi:hypothetical protein
VLIGAGPAGTGFLAAAAAAGRLDAVLDDGLAVLDHRPGHGAGALGGYHVSSDTTAAVFVETLAPLLAGRPDLARSPSVRAVTDVGSSGPVDVRTAAAALACGTTGLIDQVIAHPLGQVRFGTRVTSVRPAPGGLEITTAEVGAEPIRARRAVLAVGGTPHLPDQLRRLVPADRLVHADTVLRAPEDEVLSMARSGRRPARVLVVGGSHSAFAVLRRLLAVGDAQGPAAQIVLAHRSPLRITYDCPAAARAAGAGFTPADVCPKTQRVFRFSGLRWEAAALLREVRRDQHPTVRIQDVGGDQDALARAAASADLVVAATGYVSAASGLLGADLTARQAPVFTIGLSTHRRQPRDGGEASFSGYVDGVWFYHQVLAPRLVEAVSADLAAAR